MNTTDEFRKLVLLLENIEGLPSPEDVEQQARLKNITKYVRRTEWPKIFLDVEIGQSSINEYVWKLRFTLPKRVLDYSKLPPGWRTSLYRVELDLSGDYSPSLNPTTLIRVQWSGKRHDINLLLRSSVDELELTNQTGEFIRSSVSKWLNHSLSSAVCRGRWSDTHETFFSVHDSQLSHVITETLQEMIRKPMFSLVKLTDTEEEFHHALHAIKNKLSAGST